MNEKAFTAYKLDEKEVLSKLGSSPNGLTEEEAQKRLLEHGFNEIKKKKKTTVLNILLNQFKNALLLLLAVAGGMAFFLGEELEGFAILFIIGLNVFLGFVQEYRAEKALEALKKKAARVTRVLRNGCVQQIPATQVVPGDILVLEAGDIVSADARIIEVANFEVDESMLTGESVPVKKSVEKIEREVSISDQHNMVFMGTIATYGKAKAVVTSTGASTEFGKIASTIQETEETKTPLQVKFEKLAKQIGLLAIILVSIVLVTGTIKGTLPFERMIIVSLTLIVSTVPNSLPVIVTISLSLGAQRLSKRKMLIRHLPAAESLGAATIICSDKTGTITKNEMTVTSIRLLEKEFKVTGTGYEPFGEFYSSGKKANPQEISLLTRIGVLCNNAQLVKKEKHEIIGDPTEGALIVLGKKAGMDKESLAKNFSFVYELPFDSDRKRMTVVYKNIEKGVLEAYVKGAPDLVLEKCTKIIEKGRARKITREDKEEIMKANNEFGKQALRVLAMAYREVKPSEKREPNSIEKELTFVGLVGMIDPPREEVAEAVKKCKQAGVKVMIITGDHPLTAKAVAEKVGLFEKNDIVLTGEELNKLSDKELEEKLDRIKIIARAMPIQKKRIVELLQKKGHVVAMTGDGVNDAPAIKKADIGISMGITGSDVAKDVSKATLVDDNFATIVNAIEEGRSIYDKMIKSAGYLLSCNSGEITSVFISILLNFPIPLLPLQILLMNLLTDDFPALGLGMEPNEDDIMKKPPRNPKANPFSLKRFASIALFGLVMGTGTFLIFTHYLEDGLSKAQTIAFTTLVLFQMFAVISSRTHQSGLKHLNPLSNKWLFGAICLSLLIQVAVVYLPPLQAIFGTVSLSAFEWMSMIAVASLGFIVMELIKFFLSRIEDETTVKTRSLN